ncbi:protein PML isoform X3 [Nannospalax galili]|uniref:protein PML isoform X3 n=1 Tax=Nannospalax galili TaxID=1026970 RepID=UPI0004ED6164|nr:protein PML isoform X3 [Nannospalax galili]
MQKADASSRSPSLQQDPALLLTPTMPPPESPSEGHESSRSHSPAEQAMEEEFQFLRCLDCQAQAKCPKLLPCLHTLCSGCLEAPALQCPICQAPQPAGDDAEALDNVFFESLQRRLSVFRQIVDAQAVCTRCKESADFWCFECEQLLCVKCFEAHQWFLKHEARPLSEIRGHSVREFLDGTRKSNIFCSNPNHRTPTQTSIYCRGCSKPLCCTCALLDRNHSHLQCDIGEEIQQRQDELDTMTQALQEQDCSFDKAYQQMRSAIGQLGHARADTEELIRARVRQVVAHVQAQERELLEAVNARYQRDYEEMAGQLRRLDAVLQRIRTGGALVKRMKLYASDQEVLDMHDFLRKALCRLRQEEPQSPQVRVRASGFEEFKVRLQDLVSCITQRTDAAMTRRASPEAVSTPKDPLDLELPNEVQRTQAQALDLSDTQTTAVVQSVPGAHPVPVYAFSIKGPPYREEASQTTTPLKRKCCHTDCSRKIIKMESKEENETRLATSSPEQPRPSTSKAVSPPHLDGPPSPESPILETEILPPNSNHVTIDTRQTEERIVVISSSEDSDAENSNTEPPDTTAQPSSPAYSLLRSRRSSHPGWISHPRGLPRGACHPQAWPSHHPTEQANEQAAIPDTESPSQPTAQQEYAAILRRNRIRSHRATTSATVGPPTDGQAHHACLQRIFSTPRRIRRAFRSLGRSFRGSPHLNQWLRNFFSLPLSVMTSQLNASSMGGTQAGVPPRDSNKAPVENPQVQGPP